MTHQLQTRREEPSIARSARRTRLSDRRLLLGTIVGAGVVFAATVGGLFGWTAAMVTFGLATLLGILAWLVQSQAPNPSVPAPRQLAHVGPALPRRTGPLHPNVAARLNDGKSTVAHLQAVLKHAPFERAFSDSPALQRDASICLRRVLERCDVLSDLYDVQGPSPAILAARAAVEQEIDRNLAELHRALAASTEYIAVGTSDAARGLGERASQLRALAEGLAEIEADSEQDSLANIPQRGAVPSAPSDAKGRG